MVVQVGGNMYYIFNADNKCMACVDYEFDRTDIENSGGYVIESSDTFDTMHLKYIDGKIVPYTDPVDENTGSESADTIQPKTAADILNVIVNGSEENGTNN